MDLNTSDKGGYSRLIKKFSWLLSFHCLHHVYLFALPPLFPLLKESIVPSYTMLGVLRSVFTGMGFLMILSGRLADKIGERKIILLEFFMIPIFLILSGLAPSYPILLLFVAGFGIAKCMYHPAGLSYLSKTVDVDVRGKAIGLHESIGSIGGGLAFISLGVLGQWLGWRYALVVMATPSLLLALFYLLIGNDMSDNRSKKSRNSGENNPPKGLENIWGIKKEKLSLFYLQMGSNIIVAVGFGGFMTFLASFLNQVYGLSVGLAGSLIGIGCLTSFFGNLVGGRLSDRMGSVLTYVFFIGLTALFTAVIAVFELPLYLLFLNLLFCFFFFATANPADKALLVEHSHAEGRSSGYGSLFTFSTLGAVVSGPLFGFLIEKLGMRPAFLLVPALLVVATIVRHQIIRRYHR